MRVNYALKGLVLFMVAILISIPFYTADVMALSITHSVVKGKTNGIPGYMQRFNDGAVFEVTVDEPVEPEQVRIVGTDVGFTSCENVLGETVCTYDEDFDFTRSSLSVPLGVYAYDEIDQYAGNPEDSVSVTLARDTKRPVQPRFQIVAKNDGVYLTFTLQDDESGIKKFELREGSPDGSVLASESIQPADDGSYPNTFEDYAEDPYYYPLTTGDYTIYLVAYDGFGNTAISSPRRISVDTTAPSLGDWYVVPCSFNPDTLSEYNDAQITKTGGSARDVCVHLIVNEQPSSDWEFNASFANFNRRGQNDGTPLKAHFDTCHILNDGTSYCVFDTYDDGSHLQLANNVEGSYGFSGSFFVTDSAGNTATTGGGKSVDVVLDAPDLVRFKTTKEFDDSYYGSSDHVTLVAEFSGSDLNPDSFVVDGSGIGAGILPKPECDGSTCTWEVNTALTEGEVYLTHAEDIYGNEVLLSTTDTSKKSFYLKIDPEPPVLLAATVGNPPIEGLWTKVCTFDDAGNYDSNDGCSKCYYDDDTPQGTCDFSFWDHKVTYFETGAFIDVAVVFNDTLGEATAYLNTTNILNQGSLREADSCTESQEFDGAVICVWESLGALNPSNDYFDVIVENVGGTQSKYRIPFTSSEYTGEANVWSDVYWQAASPSNMSKDWMSLTKMKQTHIFQFSPSGMSGNRELQYVKPECTVDPSGFIDEITGEWFGNTYYMEIAYNMGNVNVNTALVNCSFETVTRIGSSTYKDTDDVSFDLSFIDSPFGTPGKAIRDEIADINGSWEWYNKGFIPQISQILELTRNTCNTLYSVVSTLPIIAWVIDLIGVNGGQLLGIHLGPNLALDGLSGFTESAFKVIGPICDTVTCAYCKTGSYATLAPNEKEYNLCKEDGWLQKYLNTVVATTKNILNADQWLADKAGIGDAYGTYVDGVLGTDRALDTRSSMTLAIITLCPTDVIYNLEKRRQTACRYIKCLTEDVVNGKATVNDCKVARGYELCTYVVGEVWELIPLTNLIDGFSSMLEGILTDPMVAAGYAGHGVCALLCHTEAVGCGACTTIENLGPMLDRIVTFFTNVFSDDYDPMAELTGNNACEGIMDTPLFGGDDS